jgi:large subunit ribosomal protein L19
MANTISVKGIPMRTGDLIAISYAFKEGDKSKEQIFEGVLIAAKGAVDNKMFTVRKVGKDSIGVERIFPLTSPFITKARVVKKGRARRAKLYFIRGRSNQELREKLS